MVSRISTFISSDTRINSDRKCLQNPTKLNKGLQNSHKIAYKAYKVRQMPSKLAQNSNIDINLHKIASLI